MGEIITLHVGQAGVQIGNKCWELFCLEHGIQPDGSPSPDQFEEENNMHGVLFSEKETGKFVPRSLYVDLEPTVVDEVRTGAYKYLFNSSNLLSGKEDAANIYCRGYYTIGKEIINECLDRIRKLADACSNLQGFMISHSVGGGTGSGLGSLLLKKLSVEYGKKTKVGFTVYPSPKISTSIVEPYNAVLSMHSLLEHIDVGLVLENEALYNISMKHLNVESPRYTNLNSIIAQLTSSVTSSMRFKGALSTNLQEFQTNLVPYPRIHFMLSSYAPLLSAEHMYHEQPSVAEITSSAFEPDLMMAKCDFRYGRYIACNLTYQGDVLPNEVSEAVSDMESRIRFVDWCPTRFKVAINSHSLTAVENGDLAGAMRSVCMVSNSTSIEQVFSRIGDKFDRLYAKLAFIFWFRGEGMEKGEFEEAREDLQALIKDYETPEDYQINESFDYE